MNPIITFITLAIIFSFEYFFPFRKQYLSNWKHFRRNCFLGISNALLTSFLGAAISVFAIQWASDNAFGLLRIIPLSQGLTIFTTILLFDGSMYFWHRINHRVAFLWRFHRVHHTDPAMDVSTAFRFHPGEIILSFFVNISVIILVGIKLEHLIIYKILFHTNVFFHHSNIYLPEKFDRIYRIFLVSPNMHRVHHSQIQIETDSNYTSFFSFWDRLFGTYREGNVKSIKFGITQWMSEKWQNIKGLLLLPFENKK